VTSVAKIVKARLRREGVGFVAAQHSEQPPQLGQGATADLLDRFEHIACRVARTREHAALGARLHDDHRDVVCDRIVKLARDPGALFDHGLAGSDVTLTFGDQRTALAAADDPADEQHDGLLRSP